MATAPGQPTLTVTPLPDEGSVRLDVAGTEGAFTRAQWSLDGVSWADLRHGTGLQVTGGAVAVHDDEPLVNRRLYYRVRLFTQDDSSFAYGPWSATVMTRLLTTEWFLSVPSLPSLRLLVHVPLADRGLRRDQPMSSQRVKNRRDPVVRYGIRPGRSGSLVFETHGEAEWQTLDQMLAAQAVLLVQQPNGECWYLYPGGADVVSLASTSWVTSHNRRVTLTVEETSRPDVVSSAP